MWIGTSMWSSVLRHCSGPNTCTPPPLGHFCDLGVPFSIRVMFVLGFVASRVHMWHLCFYDAYIRPANRPCRRLTPTIWAVRRVCATSDPHQNNPAQGIASQVIADVTAMCIGGVAVSELLTANTVCLFVGPHVMDALVVSMSGQRPSYVRTRLGRSACPRRPCWQKR